MQSNYDTLSNLIPGLVLVWAAPILGPFSRHTFSLPLTGNTFVDPILLIALCYVVGHALQFFSQYTIQPLLKKVFWKGEFFSDLFLVKAFKLCPEVELPRYISLAERKLGFSKEDLAILLDSEALSDRAKRKQATALSRAIYRTIDAKTQDSSLARKAHLQNTFYSFFRNLSGLFLLLSMVNLGAALLGFVLLSARIVLLILLDLAMAFVFFVRAKQRGEQYIKGLFWSYV